MFVKNLVAVHGHGSSNNNNKGKIKKRDIAMSGMTGSINSLFSFTSPAWVEAGRRGGEVGREGCGCNGEEAEED